MPKRAEPATPRTLVIEREEQIVDRHRRHVVGGVADRAPAGVEQREVDSAREDDVERMEVAVNGRRTRAPFGKTMAPVDAAALNRAEPRWRRRRCIGAVAVEHPENPLTATDEVADRAAVLPGPMLAAAMQVDEVACQRTGALHIAIVRAALTRDPSQILGVRRSFCPFGHEIELARLTQRDETCIRQRADVEGARVARNLPERVERQDLFGGAVGAAVVPEVVCVGHVKDERAFAAVGGAKTNASGRSIADSLARLVAGLFVGGELFHLRDGKAGKELRRLACKEIVHHARHVPSSCRMLTARARHVPTVDDSTHNRSRAISASTAQRSAGCAPDATFAPAAESCLRPARRLLPATLGSEATMNKPKVRELPVRVRRTLSSDGAESSVRTVLCPTRHEAVELFVCASARAVGKLAAAATALP